MAIVGTAVVGLETGGSKASQSTYAYNCCFLVYDTHRQVIETRANNCIIIDRVKRISSPAYLQTAVLLHGDHARTAYSKSTRRLRVVPGGVGNMSKGRLVSLWGLWPI